MLMFGGALTLDSCKPRKKIQNNHQEADAVADFEAYFIDAVTHFNTTNYAMALKLFNKCVSLNPNEAAPYYYISRIKFEEKNPFEEGLQFAMKAYNLAPDNKVYAQWYASKLKLSGNVEAAVKVLESCLQSNPKDEQIVNDLDNLYAKLGDTGKRIQLWSNLIQSKGFSLKYAVRLIELYKAKNDFASAHLVYEQIQKAAPNKYQYWVEDGNLYLSENKLNQAFEKYEQALKLNPNNWEINRKLFDRYYKLNDSANALKYLRQGMNDPMTSFENKALLISEIKSKSNSDSSMKPYLMVIGEALKNIYTNSADAFKTSGFCFEYLGDYKTALNCYSSAVQIQPAFIAYDGLIRTSEKLFGPKAALSYVDSALEYYPNSPELYITGAEIALRANNFKKALEYAENGQSFTTLSDLKSQLVALQMKALIGLGQPDKALKLGEESLTIIGEQPVLLECIGDVFSLLNKKNEALNYWKKALEKGGNSSILQKKISEGTVNK